MSGTDPLARARRLLARRGWLEAVADGYALRTGPDRRCRILQTLDEVQFRALTAEPGLKSRKGGGWIAASRPSRSEEVPPPGRPGLVEGVRDVIEADGRMVARPANLAASAVQWLASRRDAEGRPWLSRIEAAAAERLALEAEAALRGPSLTMRWDALPRARSGGGAGWNGPGDRALAAGARVEAALSACGPARALVEQVCVRATALQAAETALGLKRRTGKALLRRGLRALATHYRVG